MNNNFLKSILQLLSPSQRKRGVTISALLFLCSLLDFFSLAFFLPLLLIIINPSALIENEVIQSIYHSLGFSNHSSFVLTLTLCIIAFLFLKIQLNRYIIHLKADYAYTIANDLAATIFDHYFRINHSTFSNTDFTKQSNLITNLPLTFANNIIIPAGTILSECMICLLLLVSIVYMDFRAFAFIALILTPLVLIYLSQRKGLKNISEEIRKTYPLLLKYTMQSMEGWPEIKSHRKEEYFKTKFTSQYLHLTKTFIQTHLINTSPGRITELIAAFIIGALVVYSVWSQLPYQQTLLILGVYAGAGFRIIPSLNRIFSALLQIKTHEYVVHELNQSFIKSEIKTQGDSKHFEFNNRITLSNLSYGHNTDQLLLKNINLTIKKGERILITGASGSGKTTLLLILLRFIKETDGEINIDHQPLKEPDHSSWQNLIGYIPQNPYMLDASIAENIAFGIAKDQIDFDKIARVAAQAELIDWIYSLPSSWHHLLGEKGIKISGGQRQRLAIARALYYDTPILLMDESTNQLDERTESEIIQTIISNLDREKTILFVSHRKNLGVKFDSVYCLTDGKLEKQHNKDVALANSMV